MRAPRPVDVVCGSGGACTVRSHRAVLVLVCAASLEAADSDAAFFTTRILPLLPHNCFACHTDSRLGGLRLDSREAVLQGGKSGPAIQIGRAHVRTLVTLIYVVL